MQVMHQSHEKGSREIQSQALRNLLSLKHNAKTNLSPGSAGSKALPHSDAACDHQHKLSLSLGTDQQFDC